MMIFVICMEWKSWQSVLFAERDRLPEHSGIYVIADAHDFVWYVGLAKNLRKRWSGKVHHRYAQLMRGNKKFSYRVYWTNVSIYELKEKEQYYIELFKPELNGGKVKTYLPKRPQAEREIQRLLRTLNRKTLLFPNIRSAIAGYYINSDDKQHIVVIVNLNDAYHLLPKSRSKRVVSIKQAWITKSSYCGKDTALYQPCLLSVFRFENYCFEFIELPEVISLLQQNLDLLASYTKPIEMLGVKVMSLTQLGFIDNLNLREEARYTNLDGTKTLMSSAYFKHIKQNLLIY